MVRTAPPLPVGRRARPPRRCSPHKDGLARRIFEKLNVHAEDVIDDAVARTSASAPKLGYDVVQIYTTPRIVRMLEAANAEAERLKDEFVGVEHLLIAIADEREGESARILREHQVDKETHLPRPAGGARQRPRPQPHAPRANTRRWRSTPSTSRRRRARASSTRSSAARTRSSASCRS